MSRHRPHLEPAATDAGATAPQATDVEQQQRRMQGHARDQRRRQAPAVGLAGQGRGSVGNGSRQSHQRRAGGGRGGRR